MARSVIEIGIVRSMLIYASYTAMLYPMHAMLECCIGCWYTSALRLLLDLMHACDRLPSLLYDHGYDRLPSLLYDPGMHGVH